MDRIVYMLLDKDTSAIVGSKEVVIRIWEAFKQTMKELEEEE